MNKWAYYNTHDKSANRCSEQASKNQPSGHINIFEKKQFKIFNVPDINCIRFTQEAQ